MPSQRLLKLLDPRGHVGERRVLASAGPTAIVWAPAPAVAAWAAAELRAAGVEPLAAGAFRHVETSLRANARPHCALAVIDLTAVSPANIAALYTVRWAGFAGAIIGIGGPESLDARSRTLLSLAALVPAFSPALRATVAAHAPPRAA